MDRLTSIQFLLQKNLIEPLLQIYGEYTLNKTYIVGINNTFWKKLDTLHEEIN